MALLKDTWLSTAYRKRVQGYNHPYTSAQNAYKTLQAKGNTSPDMSTGLLFSWSEYRYPGYGMGGRVYIGAENIGEYTFDGLRIAKYDNFLSLYTLDYMPRLCPIMQKTSDVVKRIRDDRYYKCLYHVDLAKTYTAYGDYGYIPAWKINGAEDINLFIASLSDDFLCVKTFDIYTNNTDGVNSLISSWNEATGVAYDVYTPFKYQSPRNIGVEYTAFSGYLSSVLTPDFSRSNTGDMRWLLYDEKKNGLKVAFFQNNTSGDYRNGEDQAIIYGTKEAWTKFFDSSGFDWSFDVDVVKDPENPDIRKPTTPGQPSNPVDDKEGTGDNISDEIEYPAVSYIPSAYTKYWITPDTVIDLKTFLFSQTFFDNIQRLWENPGEYIVDCTYYPLNPAELGLMSADEEEIPIGNILSGVRGYLYPDTATAYHFAGKFLLEPYYNSYLDYAPYTSVSIYIPYIGIRPLDVSRITGHTLILAYSFDFNTRQITAHLGLDGNMNNAGGSLGNALDSFTGAFGVSFPFSGTQNNAIALNVLQHSVGALSSFGAMVGGVATGNITAIAGGAIAAVNNFQKGNLSPETYGNLTPIAGLYNPQQPYLIINRPVTAEPEGFKSKQGYASCYSGTVGEFSGFLQCAAVDVPSAETMTVDEQTEIENLLLGGIYCG